MKAKRAICAPISSGLAVAFATRTIWRMLPEVDEEKTVAGLSRMVLWTGVVADGLRRVGVRLPANHEGAWVFVNGAKLDDGPTWTELGVAPRPLKTTLADHVRWLTQTGKLTSAQAGVLGAGA